MKRLRKWCSKLVEPHYMKKIHGWLTVFWIIMAPVSIATGIVYLVAFISLISIYALAIGHFSSWQAARAEEAAIAGDSTELIEEIADNVREEN